MRKFILAVLIIFMFETASANSRACSEVSLKQAHEALRFNQETLCFLFTPASASAPDSLSSGPSGISIYMLGESGGPTLIHELQYAGTTGKIQEVFFLPGDGARDEKLFVIHGMKAPSSWDSISDIYAVNIFRLREGNLLHDFKASRYFGMGSDIENTQGVRKFIYPYKNRQQIESAWRSPAFRALNASSPIEGAIQKKTFLYDGDAEPILQPAGKSYLIKGDVVTVEDSMAGWCKVSYNAGKHTLIKWIDCSAIQFLEEKNSYAACINRAAGVHIEMTTCIDNEIDRINVNIENHLSAAYQDPSIRELWAKLKDGRKKWVISMKASCDIYQMLGGQRADLLNKICVLEEVKFREGFIRTLLTEAQD